MSGRCRRGFDPAPALSLLDPRYSNEDLGERFGVGPSTIQSWRAGRRWLTTPRADRVAAELGVHPTQLWPDQWPTSTTDADGEATMWADSAGVGR